MASTYSDPPSTPEESLSELTDGIVQIAVTLFMAGDLQATLQRVVDLATEAIEGCDLAGIFVFDGEAITTPAHTDPLVIEVDALQHRLGEGPCLDAITEESIFCADELADDARWPRFGPRAATSGIHSVMALCLSTDGIRGALNLYARQPQPFGADDQAKGTILAALGGHALTRAGAHDDQDRRARELQAGLITRQLIGQAEGIVMERERITADQAFHVLRQASQQLNIKLRDVAQALIDTGQKPPTGSSAL